MITRPLSELIQDHLDNEDLTLVDDKTGKPLTHEEIEAVIDDFVEWLNEPTREIDPNLQKHLVAAMNAAD